MANLTAFVGSVLVYFGVWQLFGEKLYTWKANGKRLAVVVLLSAPFNINGNIFTVAGNAVSERNIFSVFSVGQKARHTAFSFLGPIYQKAGIDALSLVSLFSVQDADDEAFAMFGFSLYQRGLKTGVNFGLSLCQNAKDSAIHAIGLNVYQTAGQKARTLFGVSLYQKVQNKNRTFAFFSALQKD